MSQDILQKIQELRAELQTANRQYYVLNDSIMSDYDFDIKLKELQKLELENPLFVDDNSPTKRVGGDITKKFKSMLR